MNIEELKKLLKDNNIHFFSYWSKKKLLELAKINNVLPEEKPKIEDPNIPIYVNYERLKKIRHTPIKVIFKDIETEEEHIFPSIYKAAQFIDKSPQTVGYWGKKKGVWDKKYQVILE